MSDRYWMKRCRGSSRMAPCLREPGSAPTWSTGKVGRYLQSRTPRHVPGSMHHRWTHPRLGRFAPTGRCRLPALTTLGFHGALTGTNQCPVKRPASTTSMSAAPLVGYKSGPGPAATGPGGGRAASAGARAQVLPSRSGSLSVGRHDRTCTVARSAAAPRRIQACCALQGLPLGAFRLAARCKCRYLAQRTSAH